MSLLQEASETDALVLVAGPPPGVFYGWWIAAASFVCLMVGINPVVNLTFGVFFPALSQEFGWSRSQAAQGVSLAMLGFTLRQPLTGKLITRYGAKRIILGSAALFGLGLLGISLFVVGRWSFYVCTFLCGAVAGGTSPLPHGTIIARWFTRRRGLAMGIVAAGGMVLPPLVSHVITTHGWRVCFVLLGLSQFGSAIPVRLSWYSCYLGRLTRLRPPHPMEECRLLDQSWMRSGMTPPRQNTQTRSRLITGKIGPSDSALAAASGWRRYAASR